MGKSLSSRAWLKRQSQDQYVLRAKQAGYRGRAVYKLKEIQDKFNLIQPGMCVIDLGAAPGSWSQKLAEYVGKRGKVIACDCLEMTPIEGVEILQGDFTQDEAVVRLCAVFAPRQLDCVLSDMAPNFSGHKHSDQLRAMALVEDAAHFSVRHLRPGGHFLAKVFQCGELEQLIRDLRGHFERVKMYKPHASRQASREVYIVARGLKKCKKSE